MSTTTLTHSTDRGTVTASTETFSLKSQVDAEGVEREYIQGFLATTHLDKGNDRFTEKALRQMAEDISGEDVDAVFNDVDTDKLREAQVGNLDHNNNPGSPFGDTRTVPAFKTVDAEVKETSDGEKGLWIKAMLNTKGMMSDTVSAVKNSIRDNFLNAFSIEFVPEKVRQITEDNKVVRVIEAAVAKGAALTGRPMNPNAEMTGANLKSLASEYKVEYAYEIGDEVSWGETSGTVRDRTKDSCFNSEIDGDFEVCGTQEEPAYLIEVDNDEGTRVGHKQETLSAKSMNTKQLTEGQRTPPQAAQDNAQMYLDAKDEDKVGSDCGTGTGTRRAKQIAEGNALSEDVIEDIASFARHESNKEADVDEDESKWEDCGYAMWKAWGGDEGVRWAQDKNEMMEKNDISSMTDEQVTEEEPEPEESEVKSEEEPEDGSEEEVEDSGEEAESSFEEDVEELKSTVQEVKDVNEGLREENDELKSELEDLRQLQEIKSEVDEVKSILEEVDLEDGPRVRDEQKNRFDETESKADWKQAVDRVGKDYLKSDEYVEAFAENHGIDSQEVKNYVNSD